jgi:hypothetical protein
MKKNTSVSFIIAALALLVMACEVPTADPTGKYTPEPGTPGGGGNASGESYGISDPSYTGTRFDINNMPSPASWNALGHQHAFQDLFHFANGNKVVTLADWEARRKEISKILQYYEYGIMPPLTEAEGVHITWVDDGASNCIITVTYDGQNHGAPYTFTINTTLPSGISAADYEGQSKLPLYFGSSDVNWNGGTGTFPLSGGFASEGDGSGNVPTLFGIDYTDPSAPSANISYAWGMSVILTVIEGIDLNNNGTIEPTEKGFRGLYDPRKIGITGYSRNGKATECIAAFAESRQGNRVGHASIGSAGSGGPALERFLSPAGYKSGVNPADPLPLNENGLMQFEGLVGKPWYMKKIAVGTDPSTTDTPGGTSDDMRYKAVRGWAPYFEEFDQTKENNSNTVSATATTPFIGWQSPSESWSGIQSLSEGRNETPGWFSVRFREFTDLHYGLDIDHVRGNEGRSKYGILCTIPFDQHYLSALIAPNGIIMQDGYIVPRNNPESQFANHLIIDEIYKMYGEAEGKPNKYIWRNAFVMTWGTHGSSTGNEAADRNYHAKKIFDSFGEKTAENTVLESITTDATDLSGSESDLNLLKMRFPYFHIDDPIGRFDYYRVTWGRPGAPTIAERVKNWVDPILPAYNEWVKVAPAPAAGPNTNVQGSYTEVSTPKFKAMDWRGLIDTPEAL